MRPFPILLSLLMLALTIVPCSDGNNKEDLHANTISVEHNHQEDTDDSCPITCLCNCCGMTLTYQSISMAFWTPYMEISTNKIIRYQSLYRLDIYDNIWQPPRLIS